MGLLLNLPDRQQLDDEYRSAGVVVFDTNIAAEVIDERLDEIPVLDRLSPPE